MRNGKWQLAWYLAKAVYIEPGQRVPLPRLEALPALIDKDGLLLDRKYYRISLFGDKADNAQAM
ncbi:hypothetical protein RUND412_008024, partial [Rhizina undulata]